MNDQVFFSHTFSTNEQKQLLKILDVRINPYSEYQSFLEQIKFIIARKDIPEFFLDVCNQVRGLDLNDSPAIILRNCPIDQVLPVFDRKDPVNSKYKLKKTFIAEAFLTLYAELTGSCAVGYKTINGGDVFHDIYPKEGLLDSQSQKSIITLGFHNDLPNHRVRPDWVNILCLRNSFFNRVSTTMIRNKDIVNGLSKEVLDVLEQPIFYTPHEVVSVHGGRSEEGVENKAIYNQFGDVPLCYFETRTSSNEIDGQRAIQELDRVLHKVKRPVFLESGDFVSIANNQRLHAREVLHLGDMEGHYKRWLCKTFNVNDLEQHQSAMADGLFHIADE